jgi:prophage regulatory protein
VRRQQSTSSLTEIGSFNATDSKYNVNWRAKVRAEQSLLFVQVPCVSTGPLETGVLMSTQQSIYRLLRWPEVHRITGKSRTQAWRDIGAGNFPAPIQIGPNAIAWREDEISAWMSSRPRVNYAPIAQVA